MYPRFNTVPSLILLTHLFLYGCESDRDRHEAACAEVNQTRVYQDSERINIFEEVGGLSSEEAASASEAIMLVHTFFREVLSASYDAADSQGLSAEEAMRELYGEECSESLSYLVGNTCMLSIEKVTNADNDQLMTQVRKTTRKCKTLRRSR